MLATNQDLLSLIKEEKLKLKENFKNFLEKHESSKKKSISKDKVKKFMNVQETLIDNLNQQIDKIMFTDRYALPQKRIEIIQRLDYYKKRKISEILSIKNENGPSKKRSRIEPKIDQNSLENVINNRIENLFLEAKY